MHNENVFYVNESQGAVQSVYTRLNSALRWVHASAILGVAYQHGGGECVHAW